MPYTQKCTLSHYFFCNFTGWDNDDLYMSSSYYFRFSEEILDELLVSVASEVDASCNMMVDEVYEKEFVHR